MESQKTSFPKDQMDQLEDSQLVELARKGDKIAFGYLIDRYWEVTAIMIYNRLKNHSDTEDVLQETFIKAYKKLNQLKDNKKFGPWLYHIGQTTAIDWQRKENRHKAVSIYDGEEPAHHSGRKEGMGDWEEELLSAFESLPEKYQMVITLRYFKGMSYQEIADHLQEPPGTISNRIHRANKLMKDWMALSKKREENPKR
ncbi:MAG: sigma-70 family RNA polymerase sigma factor [Planctomycetota bacterium]|nr:MAG: sigma-70 family RNA polymerase sigma factor [Planctomycetota bacterium]